VANRNGVSRANSYEEDECRVFAGLDGAPVILRAAAVSHLRDDWHPQLKSRRIKEAHGSRSEAHAADRWRLHYGSNFEHLDLI
jgi:hypothetical protein